MTSRWPEVKALFHAALEQAPEQRGPFLDETCGVDDELRAEVDRLLAAHDRAASFPESSAITESLPLEAAGPNSEGGASRLSPGTALGPYEIVAFIGAGGMGEVYQARDPRLKRDVAIKLISPALATDRDRLRRFEQEAQAIAALTHPNILAIYDIGIVPARQDPNLQPPAGARYLVTELLTGATLRTLLSQGPLPVRKTLDVAHRIAEGLAAAHAKHIIHRDLKPENLFITDARRTVAVLPFKNVSADAAQNYCSAGMTEEIRGQLSKLSALRLLSRSAVERYSEADVRRMAQELGAGSVVEGSVRLDKQRVRIGVQLIDAQNEQLLWAEQYDRELHDIFAVQSDVALRIAGALQATLSPDERRRVEKRPTENFAAYELYLKSQELPLSEREPNLKAIQMLRQVLELDPKFAVAQARIAYRTAFLAHYDDVRNLDIAIELARKAITLDPTLADGHFALATAYGQKGQVANARLSFLRAMELNPNAAGSMHNLSIFELDVGRYDESLAWARRAFRLAPNGFCLTTMSAFLSSGWEMTRSRTAG